MCSGAFVANLDDTDYSLSFKEVYVSQVLRCVLCHWTSGDITLDTATVTTSVSFSYWWVEFSTTIRDLPGTLTENLCKNRQACWQDGSVGSGAGH